MSIKNVFLMLTLCLSMVNYAFGFPVILRGSQPQLDFTLGRIPSISNFMPPAHDLCAPHIAQLEASHGIPGRLLRAISLVESGRTSGGQKVAWPWTINAAGKGYYFPTKEHAIQAVQTLQAQGVKSIDVGCMQINLVHHKNAFRDLNSAFDPAQNVSYAAQFLSSLKGSSPSWLKAIGDYHSASPIHHVPYRQMVLQQWAREGGPPVMNLPRLSTPMQLASFTPSSKALPLKTSSLYGVKTKRIRLIKGSGRG